MFFLTAIIKKAHRVLLAAGLAWTGLGQEVDRSPRACQQWPPKGKLLSAWREVLDSVCGPMLPEQLKDFGCYMSLARKAPGLHASGDVHRYLALPSY